MPRPINKRCLQQTIQAIAFKPVGIPAKTLSEVILSCDEAEALRLSDLEGLYQEAAARRMAVSRPTFSRIIDSARRKTADALLNGKIIRINGGEKSITLSGEKNMKIAVPSRDGLIDEHFGHCKEFLVFSAAGKELIPQGTMPSPEGCGCKSGVAGDLAAAGITHLVAGNMGSGAVRVLESHGIKVIRGASGDAVKAVQQFVGGTLTDSGTLCSSHGEHDCTH